MRKFLFGMLVLAGLGKTVCAADGYRVQVKLSDASLKGQMLHMAHYYAKSLPTIYKNDSALVGDNGEAVFETKEKTLGGIYMIILPDNQRYFEFLLDNGADMGINVDAKDLPTGLRFRNSPENERFVQYITFLKDFTMKQQALETDLQKAKKKSDSSAVFSKSADLTKQLREYREKYIAQYPHTLLANIFGALFTPDVPQGKHFLPNGKEDPEYAYRYYKNHYWDGFDFTDDRLINTPVFDSKLEAYFSKVLLQWPDTIQKEGDVLLAMERGNNNGRNEIFKYTLHWLVQYVQDSKVMGMDQALVYFIENYHMKGDAYWMDKDLLGKYIDRARKVAPNVIGNVAPELKLMDWDNHEQSLNGVKAKYTVLVFWSPDCGGCQREIPKLDSLAKTALKGKDVKFYAVRTEGDVQKWKDFLKEHNITDWINVYDPEHKSKYRDLYDVYGTPVIYLLDEKKIIRGKRLDHDNIATVIQLLEDKNNPYIKKVN